MRPGTLIFSAALLGFSCNDFTDCRRLQCAKNGQNCDTHGTFCCDGLKCSGNFFGAKSCTSTKCLGLNRNCQNDKNACCRGLACKGNRYRSVQSSKCSR